MVFRFALFLLLISSSSCSIIGEDSSPIVFGISVDGIEPGFSQQQVTGILGEPQNVLIGDAATFQYEYDSPSLVITFAEEFEDRVLAVALDENYIGTTGEGVGIGSAKDKVRLAHGDPDQLSVQLQWGSLGQSVIEGDIYLGNGGSWASIVLYDSNEEVQSIRLVQLKI